MTSEASTTASTLSKWLKGAAGIVAAIGIIWGAETGIASSWNSYLNRRIAEKTQPTQDLMDWFLQENPQAADKYNAWLIERECRQNLLNRKHCK